MSPALPFQPKMNTGAEEMGGGEECEAGERAETRREAGSGEGPNSCREEAESGQEANPMDDVEIMDDARPSNGSKPKHHAGSKDRAEPKGGPESVHHAEPKDSPESVHPTEPKQRNDHAEARDEDEPRQEAGIRETGGEVGKSTGEEPEPRQDMGAGKEAEQAEPGQEAHTRKGAEAKTKHTEPRTEEAEMPAEKPAAFGLFPSLPSELRLMIWMIPILEVIAEANTPGKRTHGGKVPAGIAFWNSPTAERSPFGPGTIPVRTLDRMPAVMSICFESRQQAIGPLERAGVLTEAPIGGIYRPARRFDPCSDGLFLPSSMLWSDPSARDHGDGDDDGDSELDWFISFTERRRRRQNPHPHWRGGVACRALIHAIEQLGPLDAPRLTLLMDASVHGNRRRWRATLSATAPGEDGALNSIGSLVREKIWMYGIERHRRFNEARTQWYSFHDFFFDRSGRRLQSDD